MHTCNPSYSGDRHEKISEVSRVRRKGDSKLLSQKISQVWWHMPISPAIWEAEVGGWSAPSKSMRPYLKNKAKMARVQVHNNCSNPTTDCKHIHIYIYIFTHIYYI
jgi:hypothetical protein